MDLQRQLNKEDIQSIIGSVFAMQADGQEFKVGCRYNFEVEFVVRDDHLELARGEILIHKDKSDGRLDTRSNT